MDEAAVDGLAQDYDVLYDAKLVDRPDDLRFARAVYDALGSPDFATEELVDLLERQPELTTLNAAPPDA